MKSRLFLALLALMLAVDAGATPFPLRPRRRPITRVPWQTVAAGGAAASTLVAAYKISDGVEVGLKTAAQSEPKAFIEHFSVIPKTFSYGALLLLAGGGYVLWRRYQNKEKSNQTERKEHDAD